MGYVIFVRIPVKVKILLNVVVRGYIPFQVSPYVELSPGRKQRYSRTEISNSEQSIRIVVNRESSVVIPAYIIVDPFYLRLDQIYSGKFLKFEILYIQVIQNAVFVDIVFGVKHKEVIYDDRAVIDVVAANPFKLYFVASLSQIYLKRDLLLYMLIPVHGDNFIQNAVDIYRQFKNAACELPFTLSHSQPDIISSAILRFYLIFYRLVHTGDIRGFSRSRPSLTFAEICPVLIGPVIEIPVSHKQAVFPVDRAVPVKIRAVKPCENYITCHRIRAVYNIGRYLSLFVYVDQFSVGIRHAGLSVRKQYFGCPVILTDDIRPLRHTFYVNRMNVITRAKLFHEGLIIGHVRKTA